MIMSGHGGNSEWNEKTDSLVALFTGESVVNELHL